MFEHNILEKIHNPSSTGFDIYANNIYYTRADVLKKNFPVICSFLGEEYFDHIALEYAKKYPNPSCNLNLYGIDFPHYCSQLDACSNFPYLKDLATLEYYLQTLSYKENIPPASIEEIQTVPEKIFFHPSCKVFSSEYNVKKIMDYVLDPESFPTFTIEKSLSYYLIYRNPVTFNMHIHSLSKEEFDLYQKLMQDGLSYCDHIQEKKQVTMLQNMLIFSINKKIFILK